MAFTSSSTSRIKYYQLFTWLYITINLHLFPFDVVNGMQKRSQKAIFIEINKTLESLEWSTQYN